MRKNKNDVGHKTTLVFDNSINTFKNEKKTISVRKIDVYLSREGIHAFFPFFDDSTANDKLKQSSFYKNFEKTHLKDLKNAFLVNYEKLTVELDTDEIIVDLTVSFNSETKIINAIKLRTNKRNITLGDKDNITRQTKQMLLKNQHFITGFCCYFLIEKSVPYLSGITGYMEDNENIAGFVRLPPPNFIIRAFRSINRLIWNLISLLITLVALSTPLLYFYYSSQNIYKGEYLVENLHHPAQIWTDENGIAHIKAENREDAAFSFGFLQARDRLWQMDFYRRLSRGKLSEILGKRAINIDTTMRQMGWNYLALKDYEFYKFHSEHESSLKQLEKFAEGVNFWAKNNFLPLEYKTLGIFNFEEWTPVDSLAIIRFTSSTLAQDYVLELFYVELDRRFGKEFADLVFSFRKGKFYNADLTVIPDEDMKKLGLFRQHVNFEDNKKNVNNRSKESLKHLEDSENSNESQLSNDKQVNSSSESINFENQNIVFDSNTENSSVQENQTTLNETPENVQEEQVTGLSSQSLNPQDEIKTINETPESNNLQDEHINNTKNNQDSNSQEDHTNNEHTSQEDHTNTEHTNQEDHTNTEHTNQEDHTNTEQTSQDDHTNNEQTSQDDHTNNEQTSQEDHTNNEQTSQEDHTNNEQTSQEDQTNNEQTSQEDQTNNNEVAHSTETYQEETTINNTFNIPNSEEIQTITNDTQENIHKNMVEGVEIYIPNVDKENISQNSEDNVSIGFAHSQISLEDSPVGVSHDQEILNTDLIQEGASNNWVISGKHTKSGKPILTNDPHLNNMIPGSIYPAKIYLPDNYVVGATYPGVPYFAIGNNKYLSWGVTTENTDAVDVCEEKIEEGYYYYDNKPYPLEEVNEEILIRSEEPLKIKVRWTRNGPLVDHFPNEITRLGVDFKHFTHVSFRQVGNFFNNTNLVALEKLNYDVKSINDIQTHIGGIISPSFHFVFASENGDIGYTPVGKIPVKSNKRDGFCKGYSSSDKIDFFIPESEKPFYLNPDKGFIVSANNKFSFNYKYDLNGYHYHHRAKRIDELISELVNDNKKFDIDDNIRILSDVLDVNARYIVPKFLRILENKGKTSLKYYNELKKWDFNMSKDSVAATIYSVLELSLSENFLLHDADIDAARGLSTVLFYWDFINDLIERISNGETIELKQCAFYAGTRDCERYLIKVFENLDQNLKDFKNSDGSVKIWGEVHYNYYPSIFFDKIPILKEIFSRKISTGGNKNTVKVSKSRYNHPQGALVSNHAASFKYICDLSNMEQPYLLVDTGVSGNILSRYYDNFMRINEENKMIRITHHNFSSEYYNRTIYLTPNSRNSFSSRDQ